MVWYQVRGYSVVIGAVEAAITEHPLVSTAIVMTEGAEGSMDKKLVAYIVPDSWEKVRCCDGVTFEGMGMVASLKRNLAVVVVMVEAKKCTETDPQAPVLSSCLSVLCPSSSASHSALDPRSLASPEPLEPELCILLLWGTCGIAVENSGSALRVACCMPCRAQVSYCVVLSRLCPRRHLSNSLTHAQCAAASMSSAPPPLYQILVSATVIAKCLYVPPSSPSLTFLVFSSNSFPSYPFVSVPAPQRKVYQDVPQVAAPSLRRSSRVHLARRDPHQHGERESGQKKAAQELQRRGGWVDGVCANGAVCRIPAVFARVQCTSVAASVW